MNSAIPWRLHWLIKKCLRKKPRRRYSSMLELERKLGRHLKGRTTKAASLRRIADYLVSRNVFEAAPEQETVIVPPKPSLASRLKGAYVSAVLALVLAAGVAANYYWNLLPLPGHREPAVAPSLPAVIPAPVSRPQGTVDSRGTATNAPRQEPVSSPAATVRSLPSETASASTPSATAPPKTPAPAADAAPVLSRPATTADQKPLQTKKKTGTGKKKKKKTVPAE